MSTPFNLAISYAQEEDGHLELQKLIDQGLQNKKMLKFFVRYLGNRQ